jgi:penicillin-binding protein 1A
VLQAMVEAGYLERAEAERIAAAGVASPVPQDKAGAHAADHAAVEAKRLLGGLSRDMVVRTTIDPAVMAAAQAAGEAAVGADPRLAGADLAVLVAEEDGAVRAMIGGRDYQSSAFNRATQARRQPGSTFKPFVFLAALEAGWRPEDVVNDTPIAVPTDQGPYAPANYKDRYYGPVTLTEAMSRSLNAAAVRLQEAVGRGNVVDAARKAGLSETADVGPALALGVTEQAPMEVLGAYMTLSSGGVRADPYLVEAVETPEGRGLYRRLPPPRREPAFAPASMVALDHMLRATVRQGSGVHARIEGHHAAGKTGTGQDSRDAWFAGYASGLVGVVWMGRDDNRPMGKGEGGVSGSGAPAKVWAAAMTAALDGRPAREPVPYAPRPKPAPEPDSFLDHLADLLGLPRERDEVGELIDEVTAEPAG